MSAGSKYHCVVGGADGELIGEFEAIARLPKKERRELTPESKLVREAGRICFGCPNLSECLSDSDRWVTYNSMKHWYAFRADEFPVVHGGRLLVMDDNKVRLGYDIPYSQSEPEEYIAPANTQELAPAIIPSEPEVLPDKSERIGAAVNTTPTAAAASGIIQKPTPPSAPSLLRRGDNGKARRTERLDPEEDLVKMYLKEIGHFDLLTKDDEVRLAKRIEEGRSARTRLEDEDQLTTAEKRACRRAARAGDEAQLEFINANYRLVVAIAKRYQSSGLDLLDLIQEGNLGMMHAVEKFDYRKGFKFSTYATWWIRQAITRGIANTGRTIRLPVHAGDTLARLQKSRSRLETTLGRQATLEELATDLEMPVDKIIDVLSYAAEPLSLSNPVGDGEAELEDFVADRVMEDTETQALRALLPAEIDKLLAPLERREREILRLRFGLDSGEAKSLEEVGREFGLTRERIRQIESRALSKLRHPISDFDW